MPIQIFIAEHSPIYLYGLWYILSPRSDFRLIGAASCADELLARVHGLLPDVFLLALDSAGRIVLAGETESANFPTTANAFDRSFGGGTCSDGQPCDDVFVTVLAADGSALDYSTYLGGGGDDDSPALAVDPNDYIHVGGWTASSSFPVQNAFDGSFGGGTCGAEPCADGFVAKLDPGLSGSASLLYSSYLGGGSQDEILAIAVDGAGLTYLTGYAQSSNFPTLNPLQASRAGGQDVVLVKLDLSAVGTASLLYSTYLGGSSTDRGQGIGLDAQGKVYLTGFTQSANFPTANALQPALGGGRDALAVKIDLASNSLVYATYLGGGGEDQAGAIAVDGAGNAHLTGFAESVDFPVANAIQASKGAEACSAPPCQDAFVARLDPSGSLLYSTYLGGGRDDFANGIALDESGAVYLTGATFSADFPTTPGSYSPTPQTTTLQGSKQDLFIAKISAPPAPVLSGSCTWHYAYDGLSRLVSACSQWDASTSTCLGESFSYSYDGAGNAISFSRWSGSGVETARFVYNSANQIACRDDGNGVCGDAGDIAYSYDAYGNLTGDGIKSYTYDAENRLVSVTDGVSVTSYTYNGDGERMAQTLDGVTTSYVLDTAAPLTMVLGETTGAETIYYLHGLDLVAQSDGETVEYFGYDGLGSVRQLLDGAGNVLFAQVFDPYGNEYASVGVESTSFGFTGEQTDHNGLVYLRARYYSAEHKSFHTIDTFQGFVSRPQSLHPYAYTENNPINFTDPSGHIKEADEQDSDKILEDLERMYQVIIEKDYGWGPDNTQGYGLCQPKWYEGAWRTLQELKWVKQAVVDASKAMGSPNKFKSAMGGSVTIVRRGIPPYDFPFTGPIRAFAPPFGSVLGDINLPDYAFQYTREYARYGVVHELGHVWDRRNSLDLSNGLMVYMDTLVCEGMGGCRFDISVGRELPPGYPRFTGKYKNYAGTGPMEDWAEAFASTIYPNFYSQSTMFNGTGWEQYWLIGPMRKQYVLDQMDKIK